MRVRCGSCRSEVEIPGPACGSANEVRSPAGMPPADMGGPAVTPAQPPPPQPDPPSPRIACDDCGFSFIVGDIAMATCPNCGSEVAVGGGED